LSLSLSLPLPLPLPLWQITVGANAVVTLEDGYSAVDVSKFFLNAIHQAALKEWLNALNDVIELNKVQFVSLATSSRLHSPIR
jgi:Cys-tRNA synthase (O-phospho-L-seryl-tRNA:Cys-tRNA synthase)